MNPYQKKNRPRRPARQPDARAVPPASGPPPVVVHRYVHPIRTSRPAPRTTEEDLLAEVRETLARQSEKLDEILRCLEGDNSDT